MALRFLFRDKHPDLLLSGVNFGRNLAEDVTYSGTIGAAMEGIIRGVPAIAFSQHMGKTPVKTGTHPGILSGRCLNG